jgi:hypothetical protein
LFCTRLYHCRGWRDGGGGDLFWSTAEIPTTRLGIESRRAGMISAEMDASRAYLQTFMDR